MIKEAVKQGLRLKPIPRRDDHGQVRLDPTILPLDPSKEKLPDPAVILSAYNLLSPDLAVVLSAYDLLAMSSKEARPEMGMQCPQAERLSQRVLDEPKSSDLGAETHDVLRSWKLEELKWWIVEL